MQRRIYIAKRLAGFAALQALVFVANLVKVEVTAQHGTRTAWAMLEETLSGLVRTTGECQVTVLAVYIQNALYLQGPLRGRVVFQVSVHDGQWAACGLQHHAGADASDARHFCFANQGQ